MVPFIGADSTAYPPLVQALPELVKGKRPSNTLACDEGSEECPSDMFVSQEPGVCHLSTGNEMVATPSAIADQRRTPSRVPTHAPTSPSRQ
mmetsp:Transcript_17324/g.31234  ORF Transcript_17324/g.31234 Transcript_17324/m.31234 type:complete len:91 (+) Transcript_17324:942-1214(+)